MTIVRVRGEPPWYVIEFFDVLLRRWVRARRRNEFMPLHYAGRFMYVNPHAIMYMVG